MSNHCALTTSTAERGLLSIAVRPHEILDCGTRRRQEGLELIYTESHIADKLPPMIVQVVLIHGITAPSFVYKNVVDALLKEGFQVLLYG